MGAAPCSDKWHAAAEMCGYNWDSFSNATKSRLVGTRYSDFYALRSSLVRLDEYIASMPLGAFAMSLVETVSGEDASQYWIANMGIGELTPTIDGAKIDIKFALRAGNVEHGGGGDTGGGDSGGSGEPVTSVTLPMYVNKAFAVKTGGRYYYANTTRLEGTTYSSATVTYMPQVANVTISGAVVAQINQYAAYDRVVHLQKSTNDYFKLTLRVGCTFEPNLTSATQGTASVEFSASNPAYITTAGVDCGHRDISIPFDSSTIDLRNPTFDGGTRELGPITLSPATSTDSHAMGTTSCYTCYLPAGSSFGGGSGSGSGGGTTNVYNDYDSHDVTTTTTIHNTTNNISTTTNNVDNTTYVTNNNYETTMDVDLQPITKRLDAIDTKLGAIGRDLNDVYDLLDEQWAGLSGWLSRIYQRQGQIYSAMDDVVPWLESILGEMVNLQHPQSGTSTLLGYVKQIVDKLDNLQVGGGGDGSSLDLSRIEELLKAYTTTPDYGGGGAEGQFSIADITSFILEEMRRFNTAMTGYTDEIEDLLRPDGAGTPPELDPTSEFDDDEGMDAKIADRMGELVKHFPYSLPWDVGIVLNLLRSAPVAPQFDVGVIGSDEDMHIDLSPYEPVAVVTRSASVVLFAVGLILRTRSLLGVGSDA